MTNTQNDATNQPVAMPGTPRENTAEPGSMPQLRDRAAFEAVLEHYTISPEAAALLQQTRFVVMVSVTAAGRNTIINKLLETGEYYNIVSDTTRPKRVKDGEVVEHHGVEYYFRPEADILADLQAGKFVEAAIIHNQQVSGVSVREFVRAQASGKIAITDIEVNGCETMLRAKPNTIPIFVLPPSFEAWMERMNERSQLPEQEIQNRLETALVELSVALEDDRFRFVINSDLNEAVRQVNLIAHGAMPTDENDSEARALAEQLREETARSLSGQA